MHLKRYDVTLMVQTELALRSVKFRVCAEGKIAVCISGPLHLER